MGKLVLEINTDNDAFVDCVECEVSRLLGGVIARLNMGGTSGVIHDLNGANVGSWELEKEND